MILTERIFHIINKVKKELYAFFFLTALKLKLRLLNITLLISAKPQAAVHTEGIDGFGLALIV